VRQERQEVEALELGLQCERGTLDLGRRDDPPCVEVAVVLTEEVLEVVVVLEEVGPRRREGVVALQAREM